MLARGLACALLIATFSSACLAVSSKSSKMDYADTPGLQLAEPPAEEAVVVFVRPIFRGSLTASGTANAQDASLWEGDELLAIVRGGFHHVHRTTPGEHRYLSLTGSADFIDATLEGGRIYFVLLDRRVGMFSTRFGLEPIAPDTKAWAQLEGWLAGSVHCTPNDEARAWAAETLPTARREVDEALPEWLKEKDREQLRADQGVDRYPRLSDDEAP